jgi:hypothetical protein
MVERSSFWERTRIRFPEIGTIKVKHRYDTAKPIAFVERRDITPNSPSMAISRMYIIAKVNLMN